METFISHRAPTHVAGVLVLAAAAIALAACHPQSGSQSVAQSSADTSPPVVTVNGVPIRRDFFAFYIKGVTGGKSPSDLTADERERALDNLIRAQVVAEQAEKDGVAGTADTQHLLEISRLNVLQSVVADRYLKDREPTDQELHAEYDTQVAALPHTEYHARHILVASEATAKSLIAKLEKGANFADLAKSDSIDPSKSNGGDLGWFNPNGMVKPFADAVVQLKPGEYTHQPVHTTYGWHIIELEGTRDLSVPSFDSVKQRLVQIVKQKKFKAYEDALIQKAKIERAKS
ncbi:MAG TPA: peptidylprolyl isomerase [Steroidobacteraceae bacterium]|nr:peptidylprolyl isomerase [Steroidobacteraceae bacterium]